MGIPAIASLPDHLSNDIGVDGGQAGAVLASHSTFGDRRVLETVRSWYLDHLGYDLRLDDISNEASGRFFAMTVRAHDRRSWVNLAQVGTGTASVLPYVVQHALAQAAPPASEGPDLVVCEEPEAHLHPSAQAELADLAIETASQGQVRVLIETHSETLLLRVRRRVAEGAIAPEAVQLLWVDDEGPRTRVVPLVVSRDGWVDNWPATLFAEARNEAQGLARAMRVVEG